MSEPSGRPPARPGHAGRTGGDAATLIVTTTVDSEQAAEALARDVVRERLAACAQVEGPVRSLYHWQGALEDAREWRVVYKTAADRYDDLARFVLAAHPYDVPELLVTPVTGGHGPYLDWSPRRRATPPPK